MSSPVQEEEDEVEEVEFVSEGLMRPVSECIDLLSDSEDEGCSSFTDTIQDKVNRSKEHATSTLDRLAQQVALEKKEKADRCRAFKEKQISQRVHGSPSNGANWEAKRCVDMWLKMPGPKPGIIGSGFRKRVKPAFHRNSSTPQTCPVINCGRIYENALLLEGHLKRFDHSPCDPTIKLKGSQSELFACVACAQYFQTQEAWRGHLESKVSSSSAGGHTTTQTYQRIVCFACPACYLLFNLRDECLQHMSAKNHFVESLPMNETGGRALPVPVPQNVKSRLVALCRDVTFNVRCSLCHKVLTSHQAAQAHFNVQCRQGCAVAKADKTVTQVMKQLQVRGQCSLCQKIFLSQSEIDRHIQSTQHDVEMNRTMEKAILQHCRFGANLNSQMATEAKWKMQSASSDTPQKRNKKRSDGDGDGLPAKRQKISQGDGISSSSVTAWFCECGLQFSEESEASKHLFAVNQIFHQCGVCGKRMGETSITRLHMCRFHGGAHLSNYFFFCRKCKVEMPRHEDILSHVSDAHSGHTYYTEQEMPKEFATAIDAKPSTSRQLTSSKSTVHQNAAETPSLKAETWMCRMCEDTFDSEAAVHKHCSDVSSHSYQKFICGHCPQKFFKESTVRRHCMNEHGGEIKSSHFCGLCESMQFESEAEFMEHYKSLHSRDYYCLDNTEVVQPTTAAESTSQLTCLCMGSEKCREEMKTTYTQCMKKLSTEGRCLYVCPPCHVSVPSYAQMKTHVNTKHPALYLDKTYAIECRTCQESFTSVPSFHKHFHAQHCDREPCLSSRTCSNKVKEEPKTVEIIDAVEIKSNNNEIEDDTLVKFLNMDQKNKESEANENEMDNEMSVSAEEDRESAELEEALKRSLLEF